MAHDNDDIFKPKLGRIRSLGSARAKTYVKRVLDQISAAGKSGFGTGAASRPFSGYRIEEPSTASTTDVAFAAPVSDFPDASAVWLRVSL